MAKLTITDLANFVKAEIANAQISAKAPFVPAVNTITGMLVKIGKQYMLGSVFEDRLPELDGEPLPLGTTIEEYFMDMILPVAYDGDGATTLAPKRPTKQDVYYSYELPRKTINVTIDDTKMQHAMISQDTYSTLVSYILANHYKADSLHTYFAKLHLIGRFISNIPDNAVGVSTMITETAVITDTTTGEAWIKEVKDKIEEISLLITDTNNMLGVPARAPELMLYVLPKVTSVIDVDVLAGAFHKDKVQLPVEIKVLENFGEIVADLPQTTAHDRTDAWALLVDKRAMRLHPIHHTATSQYNGQGEFTNYYLHRQFTANYSRVVNAHVWLDDAGAGA